MGITAAERNRRKRERKKREKEERRKQEVADKEAAANRPPKNEDEEIEIEYVSEPILPPPVKESEKNSNNIPDGLPPGINENNDKQKEEQEDGIESVLRRFHERAAVASAAVVSDVDEPKAASQDNSTTVSSDEEDYDEDDKKPMSKRKLRELTRPSVAELKRRVKRPDLVEAHDITATDPDFLIHLKGISGSVPTPRHWGRKRKYLQGKRGFEKPPFQLPEFIVKTGITDIRDTVAEDEAKQSAKQKNRGRVNPKMGSMDVDYKTLHEAFFKFQTKPTTLTKFGDLYYEGKEMETSTDKIPGGPFSKALREGLGMISDTMPPPWLVNMQRYGPPPSYPNMAIPGLTAPLPNFRCEYGYHRDGWGKFISFNGNMYY
jgi:splicing factor 3B subunit 2